MFENAALNFQSEILWYSMKIARFENVSFLYKIYFSKYHNPQFGKENKNKHAADMDVENAQKNSTSYPIADGFQLNKNCKYCNFRL